MLNSTMPFLSCNAARSASRRVRTVSLPCTLLKAGVNFVFGTTGGDRDALMKVTEQSGVYAVIVPQLAKGIFFSA